MIDYHDGNLFLTWKNAPRDEDSPGQRVLFASSADGATWTRTDGSNILFPNMTSGAARPPPPGHHPTQPATAALFGGPTVILNGKRYASASPHQFCLWPNPFTPTPTSTEPTNLLLLREVGAGVPAALGPIFWASAKTPLGWEEASRRNNVTASANMGPETQRDLATLANISKLPCATGSEAGTLKCEGEATVDHFVFTVFSCASTV
jgi:hypothetical protein